MFQFEGDPTSREEKIEIPAELPVSYDQDILVLMIRDPSTGFVYWDLSQQKKEPEQALGSGGEYHIKIYKESTKELPSGEPLLHQEIPIVRGRRSCYFELDANYDRYRAVLEYVPFFEEPLIVAQSNEIVPPKSADAFEFDREWKSIEKIYHKFYALVKKELKTDPAIEEILTPEDLQGLEELEEEEDETSEEPEEWDDELEQAQTEEAGRPLKKKKSPIGKKGAVHLDRKDRARRESIRKEKLHRRQETLRRIITLYLEKRALPGGIYAPTIPPQKESQEQAED